MRPPATSLVVLRSVLTCVVSLTALTATTGCGSKASTGTTTPPPRDGGHPKDSAVDQSIFGTWWSNTALASPINDLTGSSVKQTVTYRSYARPHTAGATRWRFWTSNAADSTWGTGAVNPNRLGGTWRIESAYAADGGTAPTGAVEPGTMQKVLYDGYDTKDVEPGERFWSDPVDLQIPDGHLVSFTWSISTYGVSSLLPFTHAPMITSFNAPGTVPANRESAMGFLSAGENLVAPQVFATEALPTARRFCFFGDSITQGVGSTKDTYSYWAAKISDALGPQVAVWNLGSGWARAGDAASDGFWLYKAKQCAEVVIALGVNDLNSIPDLTSAALLADLTKIIAALREHTPDMRIILFSVFPYNYSGAKYQIWKQTNDAILGGMVAGADRTFDTGAVLSQAAPNDGLSKPEYINGGDAHPNNAGSAALADAFLAWYAK